MTLSKAFIAKVEEDPDFSSSKAYSLAVALPGRLLLHAYRPISGNFHDELGLPKHCYIGYTNNHALREFVRICQRATCNIDVEQMKDIVVVWVQVCFFKKGERTPIYSLRVDFDLTGRIVAGGSTRH